MRILRVRRVRVPTMGFTRACALWVYFAGGAAEVRKMNRLATGSTATVRDHDVGLLRLCKTQYL